MKKEIELKFYVRDFQEVRKRLKKIGAKFAWAGKEVNWYLDTPDKKMEKRGAVLRVRENEKGPRITYKENVLKKNFKVADEYEVSVSDVGEILSIFQKIGFILLFKYERRREYWKYGSHAEITLDTLSIGKFVEIESSPAKIKMLAQKLGLHLEKSTTKSYIQLLRKNK